MTTHKRRLAALECNVRGDFNAAFDDSLARLDQLLTPPQVEMVLESLADGANLPALARLDFWPAVAADSQATERLKRMFQLSRVLEGRGSL